jgi:hypothetical protein
MIDWSSYLMSRITVTNSSNVHYYERYVNLEIRGTRPSFTANRSPSGSPTYRFSADGRRQAGDADATIDGLGRMKEAIVGITSPKGVRLWSGSRENGPSVARHLPLPDRVVYVSVASKSLRRRHATLVGRKLELMITGETSRLRSRRLISRICRPRFSLELSVRCSQTSEHCPRFITAKLAHIVGIALEHRFEMLDRLCRILALMKPDLCKRKVGFIVACLH